MTALHADTAPWALGPFTRPVSRPVVQPAAELVFDCPMRKRPVRWAANHTFNPAAIACQNRIHLLFRAEDGHGDDIGQYTSRIGHAVSADGISFALQPEPLIYPADDPWSGDEWYGGCEDPRVVEGEDGLFAVYYTMYNRGNPKGAPVTARLGVATSRDLVNWTKHGPIFAAAGGLPAWHKSAGVVQRAENGRLIATRINGLYWMYWGEDAVQLATSTDLVNWAPVRDRDGRIARVMAPAHRRFDSLLTEVGPPPVLTDAGIVLIYNGRNHPDHGDPSLAGGAYAAGQALFDGDDPATLLDRLANPFLKPELDHEKSGQYRQGTVFTEGLALFRGRWHLYYGTADTYVGVATAPCA